MKNNLQNTNFLANRELSTPPYNSHVLTNSSTFMLSKGERRVNEGLTNRFYPSISPIRRNLVTPQLVEKSSLDFSLDFHRISEARVPKSSVSSSDLFSAEISSLPNNATCGNNKCFGRSTANFVFRKVAMLLFVLFLSIPQMWGEETQICSANLSGATDSNRGSATTVAGTNCSLYWSKLESSPITKDSKKYYKLGSSSYIKIIPNKGITLAANDILTVEVARNTSSAGTIGFKVKSTSGNGTTKDNVAKGGVEFLQYTLTSTDLNDDGSISIYRNTSNDYYYSFSITRTSSSDDDDCTAPATPTISCLNNSVAMACTTTDAVIYYTTDGSTTPTSSNTKYESPITLTATQTFKAIAIKGDCSSEVISQECKYVAPVTPSGDCPKSGELFSMTPKIANEFTVNAKSRTTIGTSYYDGQGGTLEFYNFNSSNSSNTFETRSSTMTWKVSQSKIGLHITTDCELQAGDLVSWTSPDATSNTLFVLSKTISEALTSNPSSSTYASSLIGKDATYTIKSGDGIIGTKDLYIWRNNNSVYVSKITITRPSTEKYTVTFDANTNGTCSTASLTETSTGAGVTLPSATANTGYIFLGWAESSTETVAEKIIAAGETYKPSKDITLYAIYKATHKVTYDKGTATCDINMPTQVDVAEGAPFEVAAAVACDGLDFLGWNDGTKDIAAGATYTMGTKDVTLTAQWQVHQLSSDATLSDLKVDNKTVANFAAGTFTYDVELPFGTTTVPTVTATKHDNNAKSVVITPATSIPGATTIVVTAENNDTKTYTINFTAVASKVINLVYQTGQSTCVTGTDQSTVVKSDDAKVSPYIKKISGATEGSSLNSTGTIEIKTQDGYVFTGMSFYGKIENKNSSGNKLDISLDEGGTWSISDASDLSKDAKHCDLVSGANTNSIQIKVGTSEGVWIRNMQLTIEKGCAPSSLSWTAFVEEAQKDATAPTFTAVANNGNTVSYSSTNTAVADFENGALVLKGVGSTTIEANADGGDGEIYCEDTPAEIEKDLKVYYLVQFNSQGGDNTPADIKYMGEPIVIANQSAGEKAGSDFLGWFDAETGGNQITDIYNPTASTTLYAQWELECPGATITTSPADAHYLIGRTPTALTCEATAGQGGNLTYTWYVADDATSQGTLLEGVPTISTAAAMDKYYYCVVTEENCPVEATSTRAHITVAPKDGTSIIKAVASGTTTIGTVTGALAGSAEINTSGSYKMDTKKYFMVALADNQKFQAGDIVEINVCSVNDGNGFTLYTKMNGDDFSSSDLIIDTHENSTSKSKVNLGINRIVLPESYAGSNAIYVGRASSGDKYLNAGINQVEVLRAMNPMLTAMKINGNDATINEEGKTVTIELPNNGGVVPTISFSDIKIISNTPSLTEGVLEEGEWAFNAARNYTLTDKDGDATIYAITLTEAAAPCETPAINTQPESASYCAGDEMPTLSVAAAVSDDGTLVYAWFKKGDADEQVGSDAVSYQVAGAGTYYVKVKNTKDGFGDSEWVTSNDAVVTLNVAAAITTQPVGATEKEVGDHITLSVTASNATSYQWYKDEEEAIEGETNATYEFDFEATASYYVMVGSACGEDVKSDVVSVIAAPQGCNTFASIPSAAPYIYKQEGEWEITALTSGGKLDGSNRFINSATDYKGQTNQKALSYSRIGIKFAQATTSVTFYSSASSSRTFSSLNVTSDDIAGGTVSYSDVTDDVTVTKEDYNGNNKNGVFTATGFFEPNKYYWFTFSGTVVITKVCTTEAEVLEETKTISAATVNSVDLTTEQLSTLNSAKALTWDKVLTQPEVAMTYTITRKYEGDRTFVTDEEKTATITSDASNYYATCTFEGQDYVITCPIDKDPAMSLSVETLDVSFALSAAISKSAEVTLTGYNLENGEYSVNIPTIEGLSITPTVFTVADGQVNETFTVTFAAEDRVTVATTDIVFSDGITSKTLPVTYGAMLKYTLQDVSENITWDFSKVPANPAASTSGITATEDNQVMANIAGVANNADFNSQTLMMMVAGEYAYRSSGYKCFQGSAIKFHAAVPGSLVVTYCGPGDNKQANLFVNGIARGSVKGSATSSGNIFVEAGDVEITFTGDDNKARLYSMTFTAADHYRMGMKLEDLGTICLPYNVPVANQHGAAFFKIDYQDGSFVHFIEETGELQAGMPYIFQVTGKDVALFYGNEHVDEPLSEGTNGMYGTFEDIPVGPFFNNLGAYMINTANNHITKCGTKCSLKAYRAYFIIEEMPTSPQQIEVPAGQAAPRRLVLGRDKANTPTDDETIFYNGEIVQKLIINNHVRIIRNGVARDVVGRQIK